MTKYAEGQDKNLICVKSGIAPNTCQNCSQPSALGLQTPSGLGFKVDSVMKGDVDVKSGSRGLYVGSAINGDLN